MLVNHAFDIENDSELSVTSIFSRAEEEALKLTGFSESWQSTDLKLHKLNKFKSFYSIVEDKINQVYRATYSKKHKVKISEAWCSVNNPAGITTPHNHKESFLSAVYYPHANNEELWFLNPIPQMLGLFNLEHVEEYNEYNSDYWTKIVNTGDLLIFNSMLQHFIRPSEKQRMSFAVNSVIEKIENN
jgi:uncharacterized protein (TIGR02466 family)